MKKIKLSSCFSSFDHKYLVYLLSIYAFLSAIIASLLAPVEMLYLANTFKLYDKLALIGLAMGVPAILTAISYPVLGKFSDKHGRKNIILLFALLGSFIPLLLVKSKSFEAYMLFKMLGGIFTSSGAITLALIGDIVERNKNNGGIPFYIYAVGMTFGGVVGSLTAAVVSARTGIQEPYLIAFQISIVSFLMLLPLIKYDEKPAETAPDKAKTKPAHYKIPLIIFAIFIMQFIFAFHLQMKGNLWPKIVENFITNKLADTCKIFAFKLFGISGINQDQITAVYVALIFASMGLIASVFSASAGKFCDKFGNSKLFLLGYILMGFFGVLLAFPNSFSMFYLLSCLYAFGEILRGPSSNLLVTEIVNRENRGFIFGLLLLVQQIGFFLGPTVTGFLIDQQIPWRTVIFWYGVGILFFTAIFALIFKKQKIKVLY